MLIDCFKVLQFSGFSTQAEDSYIMDGPGAAGVTKNLFFFKHVWAPDTLLYTSNLGANYATYNPDWGFDFDWIEEQDTIGQWFLKVGFSSKKGNNFNKCSKCPLF